MVDSERMRSDVTDLEHVQTSIFGEETPTADMPRLNCTGRDGCPAEVDEHRTDCPVELRLREQFGF